MIFYSWNRQETNCRVVSHRFLHTL